MNVISSAILDSAETPADRDWAAIADGVRRFIAYRTRNAEQVDDLVQEVMLRIIDYNARNDVASLHALAFRIAANVMVDAHRRGGRTEPMPEAEPACEQPSPHRIAYGRQALALLDRALQAMPPLRREVLVRRKLHGQNCAGIAEDLNLSAKAVEKHITRALSDLTAVLEAPHVEP